jgi:hypothetical protein
LILVIHRLLHCVLKYSVNPFSTRSPPIGIAFNGSIVIGVNSFELVDNGSILIGVNSFVPRILEFSVLWIVLLWPH